tara:strand:- start:874 stop:1479 length:606 start_codon:yes stop_codon:yes gene_type:complete
MPIVITPSGEYIDSVTGNPVNIPPQRPDLPMRSRTGATSEMEMRAMDEAMQDPNLRNLNIPPMSQQELQNILTDPNMGMEGEMARENIPANMDMGMNSEMAAADLSDVDKVRMLIDMGLSPQEAMEAIGREKAMEVRPQEFGVPTQDPGMGALSGVPAGNQAPMPMPMPRPEDLMQRQMPMGRDRTFNPNDMLRPDNAPNT